MSREYPPLEPDPVIEAYKKDIDRTLIRENLKLTPSQRVEQLIELKQFDVELRRAGRRLREGSRRDSHAQAVDEHASAIGPDCGSRVVDFRGLLEALCGNGVRFILIGGAAARIHGSARPANDLDLFYASDPESLKRLSTARCDLEAFSKTPPDWDWYERRVLPIGNDLRLRTSRGNVIDMMGKNLITEPDPNLFSRSVEVDLYGCACRCVDRRTLIHLMRAVGRPKDLEAIAQLEGILEERAQLP